MGGRGAAGISGAVDGAGGAGAVVVDGIATSAPDGGMLTRVVGLAVAVTPEVVDVKLIAAAIWAALFGVCPGAMPVTLAPT